MSKTRQILYYNIALMLEGGVPAGRALSTAGAGMHGSLAKIISQMGSNAIKGKTISESMAENSRYFAPLDIAIVEAAEYSGNLSEAFKLLSEWYALTRNLKKKILSGLALPFFILHIAALVAPAPAMVLGKISSSGYLASMLAILSVLYVPTFVILAIMYLTPRTGRLRRVLDAVVLTIPGLGQGIYYASLSRYCNAFYMLCKAGVPVIACAEKASGVTGNATVAKLVAGGAESARRGEPVSAGFSKKLPNMFLEMWRTGEETASLDVVAKRLAGITAESAQTWLTEFARWMPRLVYALVSLMLILMILQMALGLRGMFDSLFQGF